MALKGQLAGRGRAEKPARSPERELLAAMIMQALADALAGDAAAAAWMDFYAPDIAYLWLGIEPCLIASWRKLDPNLPWTSPAFRSTLTFSAVFEGKYARKRQRK